MDLVNIIFVIALYFLPLMVLLFGIIDSEILLKPGNKLFGCSLVVISFIPMANWLLLFIVLVNGR